MFFDVAPAVAVVIGGAVAMSSTAIIIAQLTEQSENNRTHGRLAVAICLFQDLSFPLLLALVSALSGGGRAPTPRISLSAIGIAALALLLVLAAGRWLLRPLFLVIASVRSAELFSLAVLLAVLASAWATHAVGLVARARRLSRRHDARGDRVSPSDRGDDPLLPRGAAGSVLHHRRHAARCRTAAAALCRWSTAILVGMLLLKTAVVTVVAKPATKSWFKSLRTGVVVAQGGEFGFALLILLLRRELLDPAIVQPLLAATVLSMVLSPHPHPAQPAHHARSACANPVRPQTEAMRETQATLAVAERDHVVICGFGRVGQNIARVLEQTGFEYIALDVDPYRIRARPAGRRPGHLRRRRSDQGVGKRRRRACQLSW